MAAGCGLASVFGGKSNQVSLSGCWLLMKVDESGEFVQWFFPGNKTLILGLHQQLLK